MDETHPKSSYILSQVEFVTVINSGCRAMMPSLTAALLHDHVLVVPQGQVVALEVQHGQGAEARGDARRARRSVRVMMSQETLEKITEEDGALATRRCRRASGSLRGYLHVGVVAGVEGLV